MVDAQIEHPPPPPQKKNVRQATVVIYPIIVLHAGSEMCHCFFLILLICVSSRLFALSVLSYYTLSYEGIPVISCLLRQCLYMLGSV